MSERAQKRIAGHHKLRDRALKKGGAPLWSNILADTVIDMAETSDTIEVAALIQRLEQYGQTADKFLKEGSEEAITRLRDAPKQLVVVAKQHQD